LAGEVFSEAPPHSNQPQACLANTFSEEDLTYIPKIGVIAVGGAGGSVLSDLYGTLPHLSRLIAIDTSAGALNEVTADQQILINDAITIWSGNTDALRAQANNARVDIAEAVAGLDIVFIVAGMGGAAGTVISPIVAEVLKENLIMSIGVAIMPFDIEGERRQEVALAGASELGIATNAVFPVSNKLLAMSAQLDGYKSINASTVFERLYNGVISPIAEPGLVIVDLDSLTMIKSCHGLAALGYGVAFGENAAVEAAQAAIFDPLLGEHRLRSASSIWVSIEGPPKNRMKLGTVNSVLKTIKNAVGDVTHDQEIAFGATYTANFADEFKVTILAGGVQFEGAKASL
jgi:cell division protein FtsZ